MQWKLAALILLCSLFGAHGTATCEDCEGSDVSELLQVSQTDVKEAMDFEQMAKKIAKEKTETAMPFFMVKTFLDASLWYFQTKFKGLAKVAIKKQHELQSLFASAKELKASELYEQVSYHLKDLMSQIHSELFSGQYTVPPVLRMLGLGKSATAFLEGLKEADVILSNMLKSCDVAEYEDGFLRDSLAACSLDSDHVKALLPPLFQKFLETLAKDIEWAVWDKDVLHAYAKAHLKATVAIVSECSFEVNEAAETLVAGVSAYAGVVAPS